MKKMNRYLVYYFNGLVETNIMITANNADEAKSYVKNDIEFWETHCYGENCIITKVEEIKSVNEANENV